LEGKEAVAWQMTGRRGLAEGMSRRGTQLGAFVQKLPPNRRELVAKLEGLTAKTVALARDGTGNAPERVEAAGMLGQLDWKSVSRFLATLVVDEPAVDVRRAAVRSLAAFPNPEVSGLLVKAWPGAPDAIRQELIEALLAQPERTLNLLT